MARLFVAASSQYLEIDSAPVTDAPCTMAAWFNPASFPGGQDMDIVGCFASGGSAQFSLSIPPGGGPRARAYNGADLGDVIAPGSPGLGAWSHAAAVFTSTSSRTAYLNGSAATPETTTVVMSGLNRLSVGRRGHASNGSYFDGRIAEPAIWNVALTPEEIAALYAGALPVNVRPASLVFYALDQDRGANSPVPDLSGGGRPLTVNGATPVADHPPMRYPAIDTAPVSTGLRRPAVLKRPHALFNPRPAPTSPPVESWGPVPA